MRPAPLTIWAAAILAALCPLRSPSASAQTPELIYRQFSKFCGEHFRAEAEPEVYATFGRDLKIDPAGQWRYVSETSACLAWQTNLPARGCVEYGPTAKYGRRTRPAERPFSIHVHHLRHLKPDTTYHYRFVCVDERDNEVVGADSTLATRRLTAVRVPGDLSGPAYVLDRPNTTYLVTKDIAADSTAFNIAADGVTLDLGGHTVTYDAKAGAADPTADERRYGWHAAQRPCGIRTADGRRRIRIVNGRVRQGAGRGTSKPSGYNPIFLRRPRETEVAGMTIEWSGSQVTGLMVNNAYSGVEVHHNVLTDMGTKLYNRHRGLDAIAFQIGRENDKTARCHHNLIKRTRHRGVLATANCDVHHNEIYLDSYATNSYGVMYYDNRGARKLTIHHNRIFGTGFHPIGIGSGQGWSDVEVRANYIQMQGTSQQWRWRGGAGGGDPGAAEGAAIYPVNGIRLQDARSNIVHSDNVVVVKGSGESCVMRGLWLVPEERAGEGIVFRNNRVKLLAQDGKAGGYAISAGGTTRTQSIATITLEGNRVASNLVNVQFGDNYSCGGKYRFVSNTFARLGGDARYRTFRLGWKGWKYETFGHVLIDSKFEGGAGYGSVSFDGAGRGRYGFSVAWRLLIHTDPGAAVTIADRTGAEVFTGTAGPDGKAAAVLVQHTYRRSGKTPHTPHTVTVSAGGRATTQEVVMNANREVRISPSSHPPPGP